MTPSFWGVLATCFVVIVPAVLSIFNGLREVANAERYVRLQGKGQNPPQAELPFSRAIARYLEAFQQSLQRKALTTFDVDRELGETRRVAGSIASTARSLAGVLILCGLIVTLVNLQEAVGGLNSSFQTARQQFSTGESSPSKPQDENAGDPVSQILNGMSSVATAARQAFQISMFAILCAAVLLLASLRVHARAVGLVGRFSESAHRTYLQALRSQPEQTPLHIVAADFRESAQALRSLTNSFSDLTGSFHALDGFATSMDGARSAIVEAMQKLPRHVDESIEASVGKLNDQFVRGITEALKESSEHSQQILLIYGQQQHRIEKIHDETAAIRTFSSRTAKVVRRLKDLPEHLAGIAAALQSQNALLTKFELTAADLARRVESLPVGGLRADVKELSLITQQVHAAGTSVEKSTQTLASLAELLLELPELTKQVGAAVQKQGESAASLRNSVEALSDHVKTVPVPELRTSVDGLAAATEKIANLHTLTLDALGDMMRRSSAFEAAGVALRTDIEKVLTQCRQLAADQRQLRADMQQQSREYVERSTHLADGLKDQIEKLKSDEPLREIVDLLDGLSQVMGTIKRDLEGVQLANIRSSMRTSTLF